MSISRIITKLKLIDRVPALSSGQGFSCVLFTKGVLDADCYEAIYVVAYITVGDRLTRSIICQIVDVNI